MDLFLRLILVYMAYYFYMSYYKSVKIKTEKLEEVNGEFIFTYLSYIKKKEMYFSLDEVESLNFSKIIIKNRKFGRITTAVILKDHNIIKFYNKRNIIIFFKSCKENSPILYEEIFERADIFERIAGFFRFSSLRDIMENEIKELKEEEK